MIAPMISGEPFAFPMGSGTPSRWSYGGTGAPMISGEPSACPMGIGKASHWSYGGPKCTELRTFRWEVSI